VRSTLTARDTRSLIPGVSAASAVLGEPIDPTPGEWINAVRIREAMMRPGDPRTKHRGEAETIAIIGGQGFDAFIITDDHDARRSR